MRRLVCFLAAVALTFVAGAVFASALPVPVNVAPVGAVPAGLNSVVTYDARHLAGTTAANAGYYSRPVLVSNNTLAGLGRGLAKRTVPSLAFMAAVSAAGWAIDELTRQVQSDPGVVGADIATGSDYYTTQTGGSAKYFSSLASAETWLISHHNGEQAEWFQVSDLRVVQTSASSWNMYAEKDTIYGWASVGYNVQGLTDAPAGLTEPSIAPVPATDAAIADLIKANPDTWNDALRNPDGSVNRNPDVQAEAQALANELANPDPAQQPDPAEGWDSGQQGGEPTQGATSEEWPIFCDWATPVCEAIDWAREPAPEFEDEDMPEMDLPMTGPTWASNLGGGSCPAPHMLNLTHTGQQAYEWGPWCDLAGRMKPLVIASASFAAVLILAGVSRKNEIA
jgi:hypothetical protein